MAYEARQKDLLYHTRFIAHTIYSTAGKSVKNPVSIDRFIEIDGEVEDLGDALTLQQAQMLLFERMKKLNAQA